MEKGGLIRPRTLQTIYSRLAAAFGPQHWWPGDTPFEVAVGAILTQNTAWSNASRAVGELKKKDLLHPAGLRRLPAGRLAPLIRSSGYFNQKTTRLKRFVRYLFKRHRGDLSRMQKVPAGRLREELLGLSGIGPETADSILLYALGKPVFVVDAYTRRVLARHSLISWDAAYSEIQRLFTGALPRSRRLYNEYHALLVRVGKEYCRTHPRCEKCPLKRIGKLRLEKAPSAKVLL